MPGSDAAAFATRLRIEADRAASLAGDRIDRWFAVAERTLLLRFLGGQLLPVIAPALAHLAIAPRQSAPDLTVDLWDCAGLNLEFPRAPVSKSAFTPRGEVRGLTGGGFHAAFEPGGRLLSFFDGERRQAYYCVGDAARIPRFDAAEPIRGILAWFMRASGRQLIHAGAVGRPDGGALLIGRSGAGKSNTALGVLSSDLLYVADDFCAVSTDGVPMAYSLYSTGKTRESDWERQPMLRTLAPNLDPERRDKVIYFLNAAVPDRLIAGFPLKAMLVVRRGGDSCVTRPIPANRALVESAPDTAMLLPDSGAEVLRSLARLSRLLPCYELILGPDPARIPTVIGDLLSSLSADRRQSA